MPQKDFTIHAVFFLSLIENYIKKNYKKVVNRNSLLIFFIKKNIKIGNSYISLRHKF